MMSSFGLGAWIDAHGILQGIYQQQLDNIYVYYNIALIFSPIGCYWVGAEPKVHRWSLGFSLLVVNRE